jgi:hypothetical protein
MVSDSEDDYVPPPSSGRPLNRNNNQTDTLEETNKKDDVSVKNGEKELKRKDARIQKDIPSRSSAEGI